MPNYSKNLNTLILNCLPSILMLSVVGCASETQKVSPDRTSERTNDLKKFRASLLPVKSSPPVSQRKTKEQGPGHPVGHPIPKTPPKSSLEKNEVKKVTLKNRGIPTAEGEGSIGGRGTDSQLDKLHGLEGESVIDSKEELLHYYYMGYDHLSQKKFDSAIRHLEYFLEENPVHIYADRAQFLIATAYCQSKEFHLCILALNTLESRHPYSLKLPDALQLRVHALASLGHADESKRTLQKLTQRYPDHSEAKGRTSIPDHSGAAGRTSIPGPPPLLVEEAYD